MSGPSGRLLSLLSLLQARRDWPGHVLAERLHVSGRTVRRDVDRLRELGYPIEATFGPDGGYRLAPGADLPPLLFDDEQAVALAVALQLATASGAAIADGAARALSTLRQVMPGRLRHHIDAVRVTTPSVAAPEVDPAVLRAVSAAVRDRELLRLDYMPGVATSAGDGSAERDAQGGDGTARVPPAPRRVEPHEVVARHGRWYLLAWDLEREDWRTFRLDRMAPRRPTGPRFVRREIPGGDAAAFVAARFKGSDGVDVWPCRGEVILGMPAADVAPFVADGTVRPDGPDRCRVTLGAWSWVGLAASVARFDTSIEVVGPPELAEAFRVVGERCAAAGSGGQ